MLINKKTRTDSNLAKRIADGIKKLPIAPVTNNFPRNKINPVIPLIVTTLNN